MGAGALAGLPHDPAMAGALVLRLLAIAYAWTMPKFVSAQDLH
jgi:hypothetical protein